MQCLLSTGSTGIVQSEVVSPQLKALVRVLKRIDWSKAELKEILRVFIDKNKTDSYDNVNFDYKCEMMIKKSFYDLVDAITLLGWKLTSFFLNAWNWVGINDWENLQFDKKTSSANGFVKHPNDH